MATPHPKPNHATPGLEDTRRIPQMLRALRHRNFQLFFSGQLISLIGTWMDNIAEAWLVYRLTGSSLLLGTVAFAGQIPVFLLAPIGGMVADRWNRQRVVIATQASSMVLAGILAVLTLTGRVKVWEVVVLAALMGAVNAFDIPARQAFLVDMVGREDLMNAIALNSSMFNGARVIGPSIAGILVASIGEGWCFAANSISYIAVIVGLLLMHVNRTPVETLRVSPFEHIVEGFRFVWNTGPIRALLLLLGLVSLVAMPYSVLMPIFAAKILHGNARTLGVLMGATGVGALGGALTLASRSGVKGLGRWVAVACASFGTSLILFSLSRWYVLSVALLVPVGFRDDGADGVVEYTDSSYGARPASWPGDGSIFDDVHGDGADRFITIGLVSGSHRGAMDACNWRSCCNYRRSIFRPKFAQDSRGSAGVDYRARHGGR